MKTIFLFLLLLISCASATAQEIFKNSELTITSIDKNTWMIETTDRTTMYLVAGSERALLIDTGTNCEALDEIVGKITTLPLSVVVTHDHPDHSGNIRYFDEVYMHPLDTVVRMGGEFQGTYHWVNDGDVFDLGDRSLEVVWLPGHTPGSIVLLDPATQTCYSGDAFGSGLVWLQILPILPLQTYYESCVRMEKIMMEQNITKIYCGHFQHQNKTLSLDYIVDMKNLAQRLAAGDTSGSLPYPMRNYADRACDKPVIATNGSAKIVYCDR